MGIMYIIIGIVILGCLGIIIYEIAKRSIPKLPGNGVIYQSVVVGSEKDLTTTIPVSIGSATCSHDWDVVTDKIPEVPHEK